MPKSDDNIPTVHAVGTLITDGTQARTSLYRYVNYSFDRVKDDGVVSNTTKKETFYQRCLPMDRQVVGKYQCLTDGISNKMNQYSIQPKF